MKLLKLTVSLFISAALFLMSCIGLCAPSDRFEFIKINYGGKIFDAESFSDGLCSVKNENYDSGYLDANGNIAIDFLFENAGSFSGGIAPACASNSRYGYISKDGLFKIDPAFDEAHSFSSSAALVLKNGTYNYINTEGKTIDIFDTSSYIPQSDINDGVFWVSDKDGNYRLANTEGRLVSNASYQWVSEFSDGVCWVSSNRGDDFYSFDIELIDTKGETIIKSGIFKSASDFSEGVCWAKRTDANGMFLIDKAGNMLTKLDEDAFPSDYSNGLSVLGGSAFLQIYDKNGVCLFISSKYRQVGNNGFSEGLCLVTETATGDYYILKDKNYTPATEGDDAPVYNIKPENQKPNFELVFKIGSPYSIANGEKVLIDPANPDICAETRFGRTMIPTRFLSENMPGWQINWDYLNNCAVLVGDYAAATIKDGQDNISYVSYDKSVGKFIKCQKELDCPAVIIHDRMFLPVRALSEIMNVNIFYDESGIVVFSDTRKSLSHSEAAEMLELLK